MFYKSIALSKFPVHSIPRDLVKNQVLTHSRSLEEMPESAFQASL